LQRITAKNSTEDKWTALWNFFHAKGLSFTCGERWGKEQECQGTVQLHVVQEMIDLLQSESLGDNTEFLDASYLMCLSTATMGASSSPIAMQVKIQVEGIHFLCSSTLGVLVLFSTADTRVSSQV
jgi:hypothetical protein